MASIQFTEADRDARGFIKVTPPARADEPRSLADLLPAREQPATATPARRPATKQEIIGAAVLLLIVAAALVYVAGRWPQATPATSPIAPVTAPVAPPPDGDGTLMPSPSPAALPEKRPAYAAPDGEVLGGIEVTRAITPVAHYGQEWIQADVEGSGRIWLRASDWPELSIVGPDLTPRRPAPAPAYVPAAAPAEPPPPPPPPTMCADVGVPGKMVSSCGDADLASLQQQAQQQWLATYGGNVGIVGTPSPQPAR